MTTPNAPAATEPMVHTIEEVAQILRIGRQSAYEAAKSGDIPTIRVGRRLLVPRAALQRLLDGPQNDNDPA